MQTSSSKGSAALATVLFCFILYACMCAWHDWRKRVHSQLQFSALNFFKSLPLVSGLPPFLLNPQPLPLPNPNRMPLHACRRCWSSLALNPSLTRSPMSMDPQLPRSGLPHSKLQTLSCWGLPFLLCSHCFGALCVHSHFASEQVTATACTHSSTYTMAPFVSPPTLLLTPCPHFFVLCRSQNSDSTG